MSISPVYKNHNTSDFIWDFGKLPFPTHLGKYFIKIGKIRAKIHEIGKIKAIFGLGMTPIYGLKNGQLKSLNTLLHKGVIALCYFSYLYFIQIIKKLGSAVAQW